jgi:thiamine biosynthesis lipoprotein
VISDGAGSSAPAPLIRQWRAIGTRCEIGVSAPRVGDQVAETVADQAQQRAAVLVAELDLACSRFREDSELRRLRHGTAVSISPMLDGAVSAALRTARATEGLVDPTISTALVATGYDDDLDAVRRRGDRAHRPSAATEAAPGYWRVLHDSADRRILVPHRVEMDLGASAKAWLADVIAARLVAESVVPAGAGVLVNLGGDVAVAGAAPDGGWRISVDDGAPVVGDRPVITIGSGGLATSSTLLRTWRHGARRRHHIVDPRTGETAPTTWQAVTVAARSCELANAASTAAIVLGDDAPQWLADKGVHARLRRLDGALIRVGGWPAEPEPGAAA